MVALDNKGDLIKKNDFVSCVESSIILMPFCTHPYRRPSKIAKKKRRNLADSYENQDDQTIAEYNSSVRNARLVRDEIVGENTLRLLNPEKVKISMQWYKVKSISNDHISFYPTSDTERTRHFHPAKKFVKVKRN